MDLNLSAGESPGAKILKVQDLAAGYGERVLFKDLNLELARGEVLGVAGPNGAGKTSFLRDRKSTRLNSSHQIISYAVFCLKKKIIRVLLERTRGAEKHEARDSNE